MGWMMETPWTHEEKEQPADYILLRGLCNFRWQLDRIWTECRFYLQVTDRRAPGTLNLHWGFTRKTIPLGI